jgi:hypothetical protein
MASRQRSRLAFSKLLETMKIQLIKDRWSARKQRAAGKAGWILLWLLGVPIPVLLILFLLRGCT